jgi:hypothetical protein
MCEPASATAGTAAASGAAAGGGAAAASTITASQMFMYSLAIAAASTAANMAVQMEQANAMNAYQSEMADNYNETAVKNAELANKDYIEQTAAESIALMQKQEAAAQEEQRIQRERLQKQGTALASSEAAGQSLQFLMDDFMRQEARYKNSVRHQLELDTVQSNIAVKGFRDTAKNRGSASGRYIPKPVNSLGFASGIGAGLSIAASGLGAYGRYSTRDPETGKYRLGS